MTEKDAIGNKLLIICGISFSGKSTLGKAITKRFGYAEVDVDETKFHLYGQNIKDEDLKPEDWVRVYAKTDRLIDNHLRSGKNVVDASRNFSKAERDIAKIIAHKAGAAIVTVYVDTPVGIARQRLLENRLNPSRRNVTDKDFVEVISAMEPPEAAEKPLIFHHLDNLDSWLTENAAVFK
jgi:predicted kinase